MSKDETKFEKGIDDLYVILNDEDGIVNQTLSRNNMEYYDLGNPIIDLECMASDVARVWRLVEWHDALAEIDSSLWKFLETNDPNDLELRFETTAWLLRLKERIEVELLLRKLRSRDWIEDEDDNTVEYDVKKLLLNFCDFLLESVPSLSFLENDNAKRLQLIEDFLEDWSGKNE